MTGAPRPRQLWPECPKSVLASLAAWLARIPRPIQLRPGAPIVPQAASQTARLTKFTLPPRLK